MPIKKIKFTAVTGAIVDPETMEIEGTEYPISELPEFTFVLHKHVKYPKEYVVSEVSTGLMFTYPGTKKQQSGFIQDRIKRWGIEKLKEIITSQAGIHNTTH